MSTVADELAFAELAPDTVAMIRRLFEDGRLGAVLAGGQQAESTDDLVSAYQQGWQDAVDEIEWLMRDSPSHADAMSALNRKRR